MKKQTKFLSTFANIKIRPVVSEEKDKYLSVASLEKLKKFLPDINTEDNIDLLPIAFDACVVNRVNKNGEILKEFIDEENQATKKIINGKTYYIKNSSTINGVVKEKGYLSVAGKTLFYIKIGENIDYYDENGNLSDKNGNKI